MMIDKAYFEKLSLHFRHSFAYYWQHPAILLSPKIFANLLYEFKAIQEELTSENGLVDLIRARTFVIASILSKEVEKNILDDTKNPYSSRLIQFQELIDVYFREEKSIEFYAEKLHISASQLSKICRKYLQASPAQLIHQRCVLEAKRLLKSTDLSIKEIAYQLGFADAPYFTNFFKKNTGMNPSGFKTE
ncbi:helix-turn-helix transcriptional regulator [Sphingobacterium sp. N143]|nr:helix-turn-helix transcriptional regulator [Sphingobacterium sp. N143]